MNYKEQHQITDASLELLKALGMTSDRDAMRREYMGLMRFTCMGAEAPFFSEGFLYDAIGKEDARSVMAYLRATFEAAGLPHDEQYELSCLADRTRSCEFCWGDGYRGDDKSDKCNICKGDGYYRTDKDENDDL